MDFTNFCFQIKKAPRCRAFLWVNCRWLYGCNVCRTGSFFALADLVLDCLSFVQTRVAACLDFRVVNEQVRAAVVGDDKSETLWIIEPFYFSCTHYNTPWPHTWPSIYYASHICFWEDILERRKDMLYKSIYYTAYCYARNKNNKKYSKIPKNTAGCLKTGLFAPLSLSQWSANPCRLLLVSRTDCILYNGRVIWRLPRQTEKVRVSRSIHGLCTHYLVEKVALYAFRRFYNRLYVFCNVGCIYWGENKR